MNKKRWFLLSSLVGLSSAAMVGRKLHQQKQMDKKKQQIISEVRKYFSTFGTISVVYVNDFETTEEMMTGGLVFDDGVTFTFRYHNGEIDYKEEKEND